MAMEYHHQSLCIMVAEIYGDLVSVTLQLKYTYGIGYSPIRVSIITKPLQFDIVQELHALQGYTFVIGYVLHVRDKVY